MPDGMNLSIDSGQPPPPPGGPPPAGNARSQVVGPAVCLMVAAGAECLFFLFAVGVCLFAMISESRMASGDERIQQMTAGGTITAGYAFLALFSVAVFVGSWNMLKLRSHKLAKATAIAALIPCLFPCCGGIPLGIWALVVLAKPEVKQAFER